MFTVAGIFDTRADAKRAAERPRQAHPEDRSGVQPEPAPARPHDPIEPDPVEPQPTLSRRARSRSRARSWKGSRRRRAPPTGSTTKTGRKGRTD